jgi:quercetin dioxygenase-like cupin family protein
MADRCPAQASGHVIHNAISGERIVIRQSGADTQGQLLAFDLFLPPGGHVPATHAHPVQQERFTVVAGQMQFRLGHRTVLAGPGESVLVEPGTAHWFGNVGRQIAQARVEVRPALRMEELLERTGAMRGGRVWFGQVVPRLTDLALVLLEFECELAVPRLPAFLVRLMLQPFAWMARRRASVRA